MKYKEFQKWCNDRACDGCWGMLTALTCIDIMYQIDRLPPWKREKAWQEKEQQALDEIVNPINERIAKAGRKNEP